MTKHQDDLAAVCEKELLPCPFCGNSNIELEVLDDGWKYAAKCPTCKARGSVYRTSFGARQAWNASTDAYTELRDENERLREEIREAIEAFRMQYEEGYDTVGDIYKDFKRLAAEWEKQK